MCAIFGIYGEFNKKLLDNLSLIQKTRGPDDSGFFLSKKHNLSLGMNRLSVIDIKNGNQPKYSYDKKIIGFFNGCIFNFQEIRKYLISKNINFITNSDTEVLINSYSFWGDKCFNYFDGMWGVSLYDFKEKKLILSRDYLGQKPLFYSKISSKKLIYSSQINGITEYLKYPTLNKENIKLFYQLSHLPAPYTVYKNINQVEPGEIIKFGKLKLLKKKFWKIENGPDYNIFFKKIKKKKFLNRFLINLKNYIYADKQTVLALSSGIDSNLLRFSLHNIKKKISSFTIGFKDNTYDETKNIYRVKKEVIFKKKLNKNELLETFKSLKKKIVFLNGDGSLIPTYSLFKNIKKKTNNSISGDGGDELFFGYITFKAFFLMIHLKRFIPKIIYKFFNQLSDYITPNNKYLNFKLKLKLFFKYFDKHLSIINIYWLSNLDDQSLIQITKTKTEHKEIKKIKKLYKDSDNKMRFAQLYYLKYYLPMVLEKVDQSSMLNSIENRSPILNKDTINFSLNLAPHKNFNFFKNKILLKNIFKEVVPGKFFKIKKHGFSFPKSIILKDKNLIYKTIDEKFLVNKNFFKERYEEYLKFNTNEQYLWNEMILNIYRQNIEVKK